MIKSLTISLILIGVITGCENPTKNVNVIDDLSVNKQEEIKILLQDILQAAKSKDMDALDAYHLNSLKFSKFGGDIPGRQDYDSMTKFEREGFTQISEFNYKLLDTKVDVFDDVAIATFILDYNVGVNDTTIFKKKRFSMVFVQDKERWKITHEHSSPFISESP